MTRALGLVAAVVAFPQLAAGADPLPTAGAWEPGYQGRLVELSGLPTLEVRDRFETDPVFRAIALTALTEEATRRRTAWRTSIVGWSLLGGGTIVVVVAGLLRMKAALDRGFDDSGNPHPEPAEVRPMLIAGGVATAVGGGLSLAGLYLFQQPGAVERESAAKLRELGRTAPPVPPRPVPVTNVPASSLPLVAFGF